MMLEMKKVSKSFGEKEVLDSINLTVTKGEVIGLIGKNGEGKTTLMNLLIGFLTPDSGSILINNYPVSFGGQITNQFIGYLPDIPQFYSYMTSYQYLSYCGNLLNMTQNQIEKRIVEVLDLVGLESKQKIHSFSRGMKQRLGMAQAIFHSPKLLICDEPMSALDPIGRQDMIHILNQIKQDTTIIFSSHVLEDVEKVSSRMILLNKGKLQELSVNTAQKNQWVVEFKDSINQEEWFKSFKIIKKENNRFLIEVENDDRFQYHFYKMCISKQIYPIKLEKKQLTLDELFLEAVT